MAEIKIKDLELSFGDYKKEYRRVTNQTCPEITVSRAWIKVGDISFRPDEFVFALEKLKRRPQFSEHKNDEMTNNDFLAIQAFKKEIINQQSRMLSLETIPPADVKNIKEYLDKCIVEVEVLEKRYSMFE